MLDKAKKMEWTIVAILLFFMVISSFLIYSATLNLADIHNLHIRNVLNYALGFVVFFAMSMLDYRLLLKGSIYLYGVGVALLVAVYFFGAELNGAKSWFLLPLGFSFQPAELMKLLLILVLAWRLSKCKGSQLEVTRDILPIIGLTALPFLLVLIQPDLGNDIIYVVIMLGMAWIGNVKYTHVLIGLVAAGVLLFSFLYLYHTFHDPIYHYLDEKGVGHWAKRIDTFLDPESVSKDDAYQVMKSKIAIGSGGLKGEGYLGGNSVHRGSIPLAFSDSIFVVIGEEFGFIGAAVLLLAYFLLIYRLILISIQCTDFSGSLIIIGIVSMFVFQIFENIGMLVGVMPLTGITLPFVSYGGTSVLINMMCLGMASSILVHQEKPSEY